MNAVALQVRWVRAICKQGSLCPGHDSACDRRPAPPLRTSVIVTSTSELGSGQSLT